MDSRFDDLLHTVIVEKGQGIYGFFDVVMGFMYRRTDFFYEMAPGENMGFFPGQAEAIVYNYFRKYQALHHKERVPKRNIDPKEIEEYLKKQKEAKDQKLNQNNIPEIKPEKEKNIEISENFEKKVPIDGIEEIKLTEKKIDEIIIKPDSNEIKSDISLNTVSQSNQKIKNVDTSISTFNGDQCEKYNWSQGVMDVTIQIYLPEGINKRMVK
jgi:hypothetical protein